MTKDRKNCAFSDELVLQGNWSLYSKVLRLLLCLVPCLISCACILSSCEKHMFFLDLGKRGGRRKTISMFCLSFSCLYRVIHLSESHHFFTLFSTFWKQHFEKLNMFQTKTIFFVKNATFSIPVRSRHFLIFVVMLQAHEKMCKKLSSSVFKTNIYFSGEIDQKTNFFES